MPRDRIRHLLAALLAVPLLLAGLAAAPAHAAERVYEAESAALSGGARTETEHAGYTGSGYVGGLTDANKGRAAAAFTVSTTQAGGHDVRIRYANGTGSDKTLSLYVNGAKTRQVTLPSPGGWAAWGTVTVPATLTAGSNTVSLRFDTTDSGNVNLDRITVDTPAAGSATAVPGTAEAESAVLSGGARIETEHAGYSGSGYIGGLTDANKGAAAVAFAFTAAAAGAHEAELRYANGTGATMTLSLYVNGAKATQLSLPATGGWASWGTADAAVNLAAGRNDVVVRFDATDSGNVNLDRLAVAVADGGGPGEADGGEGADLPYTEYEAEDAATNGSALGPDRTYRTVPSEASGREAVRLDRIGEYVEFTLTEPADAIVVRYSIPDSADGTGLTAPLAVYANGHKRADLQLTSAYSWVYGAYPFSNNPADGLAHRFFDEARVETGGLAAGTVLRLQKDTGATAHIDVDLLDAEQVPDPVAAPAGYVDITDHGAVAGDGGDDTAALRAAVSAAGANGGVWIPEGRFLISARVQISGTDVRGAGPWHSVLEGAGGRGGIEPTGGQVVLADFMFDGDVRYRDPDDRITTDTAIEGVFGPGSRVSNVWIEHAKVGLWIHNGTDGLTVSGVRVRNTFADGVHLNGGTKNTVVEQSHIRGTGDDALAMWSNGTAVSDSSFRDNTVQTPNLANGIAIYGGNGNSATGNRIADTVTASAGIAVSTRFSPVPFSGETLIEGNTLVRAGGLEPNWNSRFGALWIYADTSDITAPITVRDLVVEDSTYAGILMSWQRTIQNTTFEDVVIDGAGTYGIEIQATGSASFAYTTVTGAASGGLSASTGFTVVRGAGNSGF
ncbi:Carbohydrate binding module (family 35) [Glycomyces sambucus]|uniref:Carbohydrate binding module (Family 35) n=1 Tax=Glycomyces sambucus TaxID=380244 RepID=A0A1G9FUI3_9ACTN|nr:carbohydrate-binding protein [Glycomyces sambucus]SDK92050.1 Carbohydrate binding module (family 35) [Glycomyces sambucus]